MVICKSSRLPYTWEILNVTLLQSYVVTKFLVLHLLRSSVNLTLT